MSGAEPTSAPRSDWDVRLDDGGGNAFDAVRLVLATMVVLAHCYFLVDGHTEGEPLHRLTGGQLQSGS